MKSVASTDKFKKLLLNQLPALLRYATALTGSADAAEDLLLACIERALAKKEQWNSEQKLSTWLFCILHKVNLEQESHQDAKATLARPTSINTIQRDELERKITALPFDQRETLLLVTLVGLDYKAVSEIVEAPVSSVMSRLHSARKALLETNKPMRRPLKKSSSDEILEI